MGSLLVKNAKQVVTPTGSFRRGKELRNLNVIENGAVFIEDGVMKAVGPTREVERVAGKDSEILNVTGRVVMPGFVDPHTHLVFAGTREEEFAMRIEGLGYEEIARRGGGILSTVNQTRSTYKEVLKSSARKYMDMALHNGTTTMEVKSGYGLDLPNETKLLDVINELDAEHILDLVPTFMGAHAIPDSKLKSDYVNEVLSMIPHVARKARFCDVFCDGGYFSVDDARQIFAKAREHGLLPRLHADQFRNNGAVRLAVEVGASSVDHLERITTGEILSLAQSNVCAVLTPPVSYFMNYGYPPARDIIDAGCIVAIATDFNPGTSMCISMQLAISIACSQMKMRPEEAITAATLNAAYSLGISDKKGSIEPGKAGDLVILNTHSYKMLPYFFGVNHVDVVVKAGKIVWTR